METSNDYKEKLDVIYSMIENSKTQIRENGFFFAFLVILAFSIGGRIPWEISNVLVIVMYGLGTFVSGGILKFRPLIIGGICCWIIALGAFFIPGEYTLLLVAISIIIAYLIPGYLLRKTR
jgi:hypothetical protein